MTKLRKLLVASCVVVVFCLFPVPSVMSASPVETAVQATAYVTAAGRGLGTAFCLSKEGLFLTNAHVVVSAQGIASSVVLVLQSGEGPAERNVKARVIHTNLQKDLALLQVLPEEKELACEPLDLIPDVAGIQLGQDIRILGFPLGPIPSGGENPSVSLNKGVISSLRKSEGKLRDLQIDAAVNPGNSGGPVISENGAVLGIVTWKIGGPIQNLGFAVAANQIRDFLDELRLTMASPLIPWERRFLPCDFAVEWAPGQAGQEPDQLELVVQSAGESRSVQVAVSSGQRSIAMKIAPFSPPKQPVTLYLRRGIKSGTKGGTRFAFPDTLMETHHQTRLIDIERITAQPDDQFDLVLRNGEVRKVHRSDLKLNEVEAKQLLPPAFEHTMVHANDATLNTFVVELRALREGMLLSKNSIPVLLRNRPIAPHHPGDQPQFLTEAGEPATLDKFVVGVWAEGIFEVRLLSESGSSAGDQKASSSMSRNHPINKDDTAFMMRGLQLSYSLGPPPGFNSLIGPFVLVSGKSFHLFPELANRALPTIKVGSAVTQIDSAVLPMRLAPGKWKCHVARHWAKGHEGSEMVPGESEVRESQGMLVARLSTPKYEIAYYRVTFEREMPPQE